MVKEAGLSVKTPPSGDVTILIRYRIIDFCTANR
jgi:hypothetical protein